MLSSAPACGHLPHHCKRWDDEAGVSFDTVLEDWCGPTTCSINGVLVALWVTPLLLMPDAHALHSPCPFPGIMFFKVAHMLLQEVERRHGLSIFGKVIFEFLVTNSEIGALRNKQWHVPLIHFLHWKICGLTAYKVYWLLHHNLC